MDASTGIHDGVSIVITASVRVYREGLAAALHAQAIDVRGTAASAEEGVAVVRAVRPHVAIIDVSLDAAADMMRTLRIELASTRILAFAVRDDVSAILAFAQAGADGFVTANGSVSDVVEAVTRVASGELSCSPRMAAQLLREAAARSRPAEAHAVDDALTARERQVCSLLREGRSNKEIASSLCISEATVKNHVHQVLAKLHVTSRGQAAAAASGFAPARGVPPPPRVS